MRRGLSNQLPKKTYLNVEGGLSSTLGGVPSSSSQLLHSGPVVGKGVIDPQTRRLISPEEQMQSRNTRGPYLDRGEYWLDIYDQFEGWKRIRLADFLPEGNNNSGGSTGSGYEPPETFVVTVNNSTVFNLAKTPDQNSEIVTLNGIQLRIGATNDYTIQGDAVVVNPAWNLRIGDVITVRYSSTSEG